MLCEIERQMATSGTSSMEFEGIIMIINVLTEMELFKIVGYLY